MNYSKAVRVARSIANVSQQELASRASLNRSYVSLIESGDRNATTETLQKIAAALNMPPHLFALLATEQADKVCVGVEEINSLGAALAELLLHSEPDIARKDGENTVRTNKPVVAKRPRISARRKP